MKNLHGLLSFVLFVVYFFCIFSSLSYADEKQMSTNKVENKVVATPTKDKQPNFQHLDKPKNGDTITNAKKPREKVQKPVIWHPRIKGLE